MHRLQSLCVLTFRMLDPWLLACALRQALSYLHFRSQAYNTTSHLEFHYLYFCRRSTVTSSETAQQVMGKPINPFQHYIIQPASSSYKVSLASFGSTLRAVESVIGLMTSIEGEHKAKVAQSNRRIAGRHYIDCAPVACSTW